MTHDMPSAPVPPEAAPAGARRRDDRGSALIISMMIMVILTMLGVTFAVLATQEERISVNARDHDQVLYAAEAACDIARTWFQDPSSANLFKPADNEMNTALRKGTVFKDGWDNNQERALMESSPSDTDPEVDASAGNTYVGGSQNGNGSARFDKPFRGSYKNSFWGRQLTPDVVLCGDAALNVDGFGGADCNATMKGYMDKLNRAISMTANLRGAGHSSRDFGTVEIEQIRVYRPPLDYILVSRYGIATVEATAVKRIRNQIVARRTVREVLQEIPFPGPSGAIESEGEISAGGSAGVHWGQVVSSATSDDIVINSGGNNWADAAAARSASSRWGYHYTINPAAFGRNADATHTGVSFLTEASGSEKNFTTNATEPPVIGDPWLMFRARRSILGGPGSWAVGAVQPSPWDNTGAVIATNGGVKLEKDTPSNQSHYFQRQIVRFPPIDYDIWKSVAQSGMPNMNYFKWTSGTSYQRNGTGTAQVWTDWLSQLQTGIFFFDTADSARPDHLGVGGASTNLTGDHGWQTGLVVHGFVYLNSAQFHTNGIGSVPTMDAQMPGEPFLDDGIDLHGPSDTKGDDCICIRYDKEQGCVLGARPIRYWWDASAVGTPERQTNCVNPNNDGDDCPCNNLQLTAMRANDATKLITQREAETFRNGVWDSDIDNDGVSDAGMTLSGLTNWAAFVDANDNSNDGFGTNGGVGWLTQSTPNYPTTRKSAQGAITGQTDADWRRDPRFLNHLGTGAHNIGAAGVLRMVYEPFLNFDYPDIGANTVGGWAVQPQNHGPRTDWRASGDPVERTGGVPTRVTTRARDAIGGIMQLDVAIDGIFYCEGEYSGAGNLKVYGSLLMRGGYSGTGSVDTWFNEAVVRGDWPPAKWKLPRVYVTGHDTL
jgi:type II secretory pathway pseudopilin PulG